MKSAHGGGNHDLYDTSGGSASVSGGGHHPGDHRGNSSNNGVSHPLSSANPPGLPRPPFAPSPVTFPWTFTQFTLDGWTGRFQPSAQWQPHAKALTFSPTPPW